MDKETITMLQPLITAMTNNMNKSNELIDVVKKAAVIGIGLAIEEMTDHNESPIDFNSYRRTSEIRNNKRRIEAITREIKRREDRISLLKISKDDDGSYGGNLYKKNKIEEEIATFRHQLEDLEIELNELLADIEDEKKSAARAAEIKAEKLKAKTDKLKEIASLLQ